MMLFSADWFRPYWYVTGFQAQPASNDLFQQEMRSQVKALMSDADQYWNVSFNERRLDGTRQALLESLRRHAAPEADLRLIEGDVQAQASNDVVAEVSTANWGDYEGILEQLKSAELEGTEWDRYLVGLTPDLPDLVQNFALQVVRYL
ncbi:MAG: hypothetical protein ACJ8EI_07415 [Sphingomicrobium sp.]